MKKLVVSLLILSAAVLGGCSSEALGYQSELTASAWSAQLDGGARVRLSFSGDSARFTIENGGERADIGGSYIADESTFVIFVPETGQNYAFDYTPKGDTLELKWEGGTLTLESEE